MIQSTSRLIVCTAPLVGGLAVRLACAQDPMQVVYLRSTMEDCHV